MIEERADKLLSLPVTSRRLGLSQKGQQMFGVITFDVDNAEKGLSIGFRNSYNKTLSVGLCAGQSVFVCSNMCFSGDEVFKPRKHTVHAWDDILKLINHAVLSASEQYTKLDEDFDVWKQVEISERQGAALIGQAIYDANVLRPQQATTAFGDWRKARHPEFKERTAWSLYNCFTEAIKRTPAGQIMDAQIDVHRWFRERHANEWNLAA